MSDQVIQRETTRKLAIGLLVLLLAVYVLSTLQLKESKTQSVQSGASTDKVSAPHLTINASTDVSNSTVSSIAKAVGQVSGMNELVVLPSSTQSGYTVSATINLDDLNVVNKTLWSHTIQNETATFFNEVYDSGEPIFDAQIYFLLRGQLVAGAGLGKNSYNKLTVTTSGQQGALIRALESDPVVANQGPNDEWYQITNANLLP